MDIGKEKIMNETVNEKNTEEMKNADSACTENNPVELPESEIKKEEGREPDPETEKTEKNGESDDSPADAGEEKKARHTLKAEIKNLKEENKKLAASFAELEDRYLRMMAEYDNFRRRSQKERESAYSDAYCDALKEILPVIDNLERALTFANKDSNIDDKMAEGVVMTLNQFNEALTRMGVVTVGAKGDRFDPDFHNAIMHEADETKGESEIDEVFLKGYKREEKVIRYAMVKVVN